MTNYRALYDRRQRERSNAGRRRPIPLPPPIHGLHTKNADGRRGSDFAQTATNLWSTGEEVECRPGYAAASGFASNCIQAWTYEFGGSGPQAVFRTSTGLASDDGGTTATVTYTADIMAAEISNRLAFVGGGATPRLWDGTSFTTPTWTLPGAAVDALTDMTGVVTHHDRIFLWNEDSDECGFYYAEQVAGLTPVTFLNFPLYALGNIKGRVKVMISLSIDAGHGANDVLAIITTTGQIVVYEGLDPSDENDWRIWGRVPGTSNTVAPNAVVHVGTDAFVATRAGVYSIRALLSQGSQATIDPPTEAIAPDIVASVEAGKAYRGWQMIADPDGGFILLNHPTASDSYAQWVYVYDAQGWFYWTVPARSWFVRDDALYFVHTDGDPRLFGAAGDDGSAIAMTWWSKWIPVAQSEVVIGSMSIDLMAKAAVSLSVTVLTDNRATSQALAEAVQTVAISPQDTAGSDFQLLNEKFLIDAVGRFVQVRVTLSATEAKWLGTTLLP